MAFISRTRHTSGAAEQVRTLTPTAAGPLFIPDVDNVFLVSASSPVTIASGSGATSVVVTAARATPGRVVTLIGATGTSAVTFTGTSAASVATAGQVSLGAGTRALSARDALTLIQHANGTWSEISFVDNS